MFGNILSAKISQAADGSSLGYGFVQFDSDEAAAKAIEKVNNMEIKEWKVTVTAFKAKETRPSDKSKFTNVYVKDLPEEWSEQNMNEVFFCCVSFDVMFQRLFQFFSQYGLISNSVMMQAPPVNYGNDAGKIRKFGFVNFATSEQANNVMSCPVLFVAFIALPGGEQRQWS